MSESGEVRDTVGGSRRSRASGLHARTFEMELLVSGAVVYGLLHLPSRVGRSFDLLEVGLAGGARLLVITVEGYVLLVLYALLGVFLLHLAARAYWIGLVGLESVFPEGIRWQRLRLSPLTRERYRRSVKPLAATIDRVDDLCSLLFSFGFLIVLTFVYSVVVIAVAVVAEVGVSRLLLGGEHAWLVFWIVLGTILGIHILAGPLDRRLGARLAANGRTRRLLGRFVAVTFALSPMRWVGTVQLTLHSNLSSSRVTAATLLVVTGLGLVQVGRTVAGKGVRFDTMSYFPGRLEAVGIDSRHYRDQRPPGFVDEHFPSIQGDMIGDGFVKLVIPYVPRRDDPHVEEACEGLVKLHAGAVTLGRDETVEGDAVRAAAACLGALYGIHLDGSQLEGQVFDFTREPGTGLGAIVTFIPVAGLEPGRHELLVVMPARRRLLARTDEEPTPTRHLIPFWV